MKTEDPREHDPKTPQEGCDPISPQSNPKTKRRKKGKVSDRCLCAPSTALCIWFSVWLSAYLRIWKVKIKCVFVSFCFSYSYLQHVMHWCNYGATMVHFARWLFVSCYHTSNFDVFNLHLFQIVLFFTLSCDLSCDVSCDLQDFLPRLHSKATSSRWKLDNIGLLRIW